MTTGQDAPRCGPLVLLGGEGLRAEAQSVWQGFLTTGSGVIAVVPAALAARKVGTAERRAALWVETLAGLGIDARLVPVTSRAVAHDPVLAAQFAGVGGIVLTGGEPRTLADTLGGSAAWAAMLAAHRQGAPLIACGGAAAALGEHAYAPVQPVPPTPDALAYEAVDGLGLLPGVAVLPAFDWLPAAAASRIGALVGPDVWLVGLDVQAALVADAAGWHAAGKGSVTVWQTGSARRHFAPGETLPHGLLPSYPVR